MDKAFAWIGYIMEWFGRFIPRRDVVPSTHGYIKWVGGFTKEFRTVTGLGGVVWYWPLTTEVLLFPVVRQTTPLPSQIVTTGDNKTVAVSGMLVYEVSDIEKLLGHTYDPDDTVKDIAQSALTDVLGHMSWPDIQKGQGKTLDTKLRNAAKKDLEDYGVNVLKFSLTTLALCKVHRLITSQFTEGEVK
jgi:regulator of protease activity HflC (stomatin/prohibitin superfamily)